LKILHIIDYFQPILGYQETYLAKAQINKGHSVRVITSDRYAPVLYIGHASKDILGSRIRENGIFVEEDIEVVRLKCKIEFLNNLWLENLEKTILEFKPDVIHVHGVPSISALRVSRLKSKLNDIKLVYDDHMNYNAMRSSLVYPFYKTFKLFFSNIILKNANELVAVTEETKCFMNEMYGFPLDEIHVIPLGCDTKKFYRNEDSRKKLRKKYAISDNQIVFCYVGKIIPEKRVELLVNAGIEIMKNSKNVIILCVGGADKDYLESIQKKIVSSPFSNKFIFLPAVPSKELYMYYSMADVGVWPKQCSITMLEAMACNLPLIVSDNSKATEGVANGNSGFTYKEEDLSDLIKKMEIFLDLKVTSDMGNKARQISELYDWENISKSFEHIYETA
jgi:glycosyltransferase involved in cell wall biosynthesis